jgi:hypothetical protein
MLALNAILALHCEHKDAISMEIQFVNVILSSENINLCNRHTFDSAILCITPEGILNLNIFNVGIRCADHETPSIRKCWH